MIGIETALTFILSSILLSLSPGPDNIFVLSQSTLYGKKAGIFITLGLCTGLIFHTLLVTLGVAALLKTSEIAYNILKFSGAFYLIILAIQIFKSKMNTFNSPKRDQLPSIKLYKRGIIMNIINPKVSIFFLAFLPQFTSKSQGNISLQLILLGGLFILSAFSVFSLIALTAGHFGEKLQQSIKMQMIIKYCTVVIFVGLAIKLMFNN